MGNVETAGALRVEAADSRTRARRSTPWMKIRRHWQYYLMVAAPLIYIIIFKYIPMVGAQIAFRDFSPVQGIWGSRWVGLQHFLLFFQSPNFWPLVRNVLSINVLVMTLGFVAPIILALALNEVRNRFFKRSVQMITYFPHFISTVVMASMIILFLNPRVGFIGTLAVSGAGTEGLHGGGGRVPLDLRVLRDLAALRVRRHHLHGRAGRHQPGTVRSGAHRWRLAPAEDASYRPDRYSADDHHSADPAVRGGDEPRVREGVPATEPTQSAQLGSNRLPTSTRSV